MKGKDSGLNLMEKAHRLVIYLPSRWGKDPIPQEVRERSLEDCFTFLSGICGGATRTDGMGIWNGPDGPEMEKVTLIFGFSEGDLRRMLPEIAKFCRKLKAALRQKAVAFELDSELYLI